VLTATKIPNISLNWEFMAEKMQPQWADIPIPTRGLVCGRREVRLHVVAQPLHFNLRPTTTPACVYQAHRMIM